MANLPRPQLSTGETQGKNVGFPDNDRAAVCKAKAVRDLIHSSSFRRPVGDYERRCVSGRGGLVNIGDGVAALASDWHPGFRPNLPVPVIAIGEIRHFPSSPVTIQSMVMPEVQAKWVFRRARYAKAILRSLYLP